MSNSPLVSIMIPTYNQANTLPKAIESALNQDYDRLEIVVSDDNSTDNTKQVVQQYLNHPKVKYFVNSKNIGRVKNYKHLLENLADGDWVVNLDGDDFFTSKDFISKSISSITDANGTVAFLQAGHTLQTPSGEVLGVSLPPINNELEVINGVDYFLNFNHFSHLATLYNRQLALKLDFYRYDILSADIESLLRLALLGKVIMMKKSVGVWLQHEHNESKKLSPEVIEKNMARITGPYHFAVTQKLLSPGVARSWRNKTTNKYLLQYLTLYFSNRKRLNGYFSHVASHYPVRLLLLAPFALLKSFKLQRK